MKIFNQKSRTQNMMQIAIVSEICTILNLIFGFVYRSIFLSILSAEYLGINGLFTQILQLLSLADLGIAGAITFRFYKPIQQNDVIQVGKLMNFFKTIYRIILLAVIGIGLSLLPFLHFLIEDTSEIPSDVNLYAIYLLFLIQSASSYMFAYRQTLLTADQKQYVVSLMQLVGTFLRYVGQTAFLICTHNYSLTIAINIALNILSNYVVSVYAKRKYAPVFEVKETLNALEKKEIFNDTKATLCHKIGGVVLNSTDSVILSKFVGLLSVGLYSNYSLIIGNLSTLAKQILSNTTASLGNACAELNTQERYKVYMNLVFLNLWIASTLTVCLYVLINPFIKLWVGESMLLSRLTVLSLCAQFFFELARQVNLSYTSACGLFVKDIYRPFIEAGINLGVSIILVNILGIAGVFLGTVISCVTTVTWREPYLIFKYDLKRKANKYIFNFILFICLTVILCVIFEIIFTRFISNYLTWIISSFAIMLLTQCVFVAFTHRMSEFEYMVQIIKRIFRKVLKKKR